jgi:hypothetical protein
MVHKKDFYFVMGHFGWEWGGGRCPEVLGLNKSVLDDISEKKSYF